MQKQDHERIEPRFWSISQLASYLGISPHLIYKKMSQRQFPIPSKRILGGHPRFDRRDVEVYLNSLEGGHK